jgi:hypothetical protein
VFDVVKEKVGDSAELSTILKDVAMTCVIEVLDRAGEGVEQLVVEPNEVAMPWAVDEVKGKLEVSLQLSVELEDVAIP